MLVACFHGNPFEKQFAVRLRSSAESLGIKCRLFDRTDLKDLPASGAWKPKALLGVLESYPQDDVLLLDPDTGLNRRPDILLDEKDFDAALRYDGDALQPGGPIFVRQNPRMRRIMKEWDHLTRTFPETPELNHLSRLLGQSRSSIEVRRLPVTYAWVEGVHREKHPRALPVVTHFRTEGMISTRMKVAQ